jgi:hypothetical protein
MFFQDIVFYFQLNQSQLLKFQKNYVLFSNYGFPDKLFSDLGSEFNNNTLKLVEKKFGIEHV